MDKIGFLYTIGLLLMALTVLSIAIFIADVDKDANENVADLVKYERLYNLDSSINQGFVEIFNVASGIRFIYNNATNNTLFIRENLPNTNSSIFQKNMTNFERYINKTSNLPSDNVTLYLGNLASIKSNLPLIIMPYNITYSHTTSFGGNTIRLIPKQFNFYGYNISISSPTAISTAEPPNIWKPVSGSDLRIFIRMEGTSVKKNQYISSSGLSYFLIKSSGGTNLINISINNSRLFINNLNPSNKLTVSTGIMMKGNLNELTRIHYPRKIYNITLPDLNIKTSSDVMLLSLNV